MTIPRRSWRIAHGDVSQEFKERRGFIIDCARKLYEQKGVSRTRLADIAREAGLTRELLYYYFLGKEDITAGVLDTYVEDAVETARLWCDSWSNQIAEDEPLSHEMVADAVVAIRRFSFQNDGKRRPMFEVIREVGEEQSVISRMSEEIMREMLLGPMGEGIKLSLGFADEKKLARAFKFVFFGVYGLFSSEGMKSNDGIVEVLLASRPESLSNDGMVAPAAAGWAMRPAMAS